MKSLIMNFCMLLLMATLSGCAAKMVRVDPNLPNISGLKTISDMTEVAFEWSPVDNTNVEGYYLYRSSLENSNMVQVAQIKDRYTTHYLDTGLTPDTEYKYQLKTYDKNGGISSDGEIIAATTSRLIDSVSFAQAIYGLPNRVKILWRPHPDLRVASYIIERNDISNDKWYEIAEIKGRLNVEYIDTGLDSNHHYKYRILVKTFSGVKSAPSPVISAQTKALPTLVSNLKATTNLPKKITLSWDANNQDDFSYYNIYRSSNEIFPLIKIAETSKPTYDDLINKNGSQMYYKVTAVDKDGLESPKQSNASIGATLTTPKTPIITGIKFDGIGVQLSWSDEDNRGVKYTILKSSAAGEEKIEDIADTTYNDQVVQLGLEYTYRVISIDKYGLSSPASQKAMVIVR